ncbi:unnamed protein product, partial [Didymodactylos carnosus]
TGHQLRAFAGIKFEITNEASLYQCNEIDDNNHIVVKGVRKKWNEMKLDYQIWDFDLLKTCDESAKLKNRGLRFNELSEDERLDNEATVNKKAVRFGNNADGLETGVDLGGLTLQPGMYKFASTASIAAPSAQLTLSGSGVFIFQI